jgi:hypothetical protein
MSGYVYFISGPRRLKIGYSAKPSQRVPSVVYKYREFGPLVCRGYIAGTRTDEDRYHNIAAKLSIRYGEWFEHEDPVLLLRCLVNHDDLIPWVDPPKKSPTGPKPTACPRCGFLQPSYKLSRLHCRNQTPKSPVQILTMKIPRTISTAMKKYAKSNGFLLNRLWLDAAREYLQNRDEGNHDDR